eukprot:GHRQ01028065.1.p1 GENE.GHRQ01028065.1~~GHRQ01028065.1.p1  ORF type:complete len:132 (+),score=20.35 GHRQ01028065.1:445-840(+)
MPFGAMQHCFISATDSNGVPCKVYSVTAVALSIGQVTSGTQPQQQPSYELGIPGESRSEFLFGVFNAIATVCFAWGGHNVALEIQATLPYPPSTVEPMMQVRRPPSRVAATHTAVHSDPSCSICTQSASPC